VKKYFMISIVAICSVAGLVSCGGGGGSSSSSTTLSGTASVGAPMASATITLTDVTGATLTTTSDSTGAYSFGDISSLKTPILVSATGYVGGSKLTYSGIVTSVSSGTSTVANVTPLTDAIVYQAAGKSPGSLLSSPTLMSSISSSAVSTSATNVASAVANVLNGITSGSASGYNPNTTSFVANGSSAYDKVYDLVKTYVSPTSGSSGYTINIADKSGALGITSIQSGQTVTPLSAIPSAISSLSISTLESELTYINNLMSTVSGLNSAAFNAFLSDSFLNSGASKSQILAFLQNSSSSFYLYGAKFSNPVINACYSNNTCNASFLITLSNGTATTLGGTFIYSGTNSNIPWQLYGDQQGNLRSDFVSNYASLSNSSGTITYGLDFQIEGNTDIVSAANNPYNSAIATFQDSSGNVDFTIRFIQKTSVGGACSPSNSSYPGLLITDITNPSSTTPDLTSTNACSASLNYTSGNTTLNTVNTNIAKGGYKLVVKAYTSSDWSGTAVTNTYSINSPLLSSNVVNSSMFPLVSTVTGSSGPAIAISNASDYILIGSVCMSTQSSCDLTNQPSYTSVYSPTISNIALLSKYSPISSWPSGSTVQSYYVHAENKKYGYDLRVTN
jgi:hypothetical protein